MSRINQIEDSRKLLGLDETATLKEIKDAYRNLALRYHPDRCKGEKKKECEDMFKKISRAKDILMVYCAGYKISFKEKDVRINIMGKDFYEHLKRFYDGWWGDLGL
jgi:hypothetical protein